MRCVAQTYGKLDCKVESLFTLGSPVGLFMTLRGASAATGSRCRGSQLLPPTVRLYNLFHALDPVAYRVEPLVLDDDGRERRCPGCPPPLTYSSVVAACRSGLMLASPLFVRLRWQAPAWWRSTRQYPCSHTSRGNLAAPLGGSPPVWPGLRHGG